MENEENAAEPYFDIKIAERLIRVYPLTSSLAQFCRDYVTSAADRGDSMEVEEEQPDAKVGQAVSKIDLEVKLTWDDIVYERELAQKEGFSWQATDAYLETLALARKTAVSLLNFNVLLFHASCIAVDGDGYCFAAPSGVGKSTHARLWKDMLGDRVTYINDDKPFLKIDEEEVTAYGSPWDGGRHLSSNQSVPVKAVYLLSRGKENIIKDISADEAFPLLLGQIYRPHDEEALKKILPLIDRLSRTVKLYSLQCNTEPEAAIIAYNNRI